jgi:poly-gamma-glutamate synthesis protein (capsule biosynthesis protein)
MLALSCNSGPRGRGSASATSTPTNLAPAVAPAATAPPPPPSAAAEAPSAEAEELTLIAGGDVGLGRLHGQLLLKDPEREDLTHVRPWLEQADLRFVNLESIIFDRGTSTQSPDNHLVFNAPPAAAKALRRAQIDIVSLANNHAWDYGQSGLFETFEHLEAAGIAYVGAGRTRELAYAPRVVTRNGMSIAFIAVTSIWNQTLRPHPGRDHVADADRAALVETVKRTRARRDVDKIVVSHHGGEEHNNRVYRPIVELLRAAVDAGADAVIGHHPHVVQRVALRQDKPVFYSLGNLVFRVNDKAGVWGQFGTLARLRFRKGAPTETWLCPYRINGLEVAPLSRQTERARFEKLFRARLEHLLHEGALIEPDAVTRLGPFEDDGCARVLSTG